VSLIQNIVNHDKDNERARASTLSPTDLQNEADDEIGSDSPTVNGEDEPGEEEDSEARPLIRHRSRPTSRDGTSSGQQAEGAGASLSDSEAKEMQKLVKKLRLQVSPISALRFER